MKRFRNFESKIGLSILSLIIILLVLEITFRFKAHSEEIKGLQTLKEVEHHINNYQGEIFLRHIMRLSNNPRIIYELIPNLAVKFHGESLKTNSDGFRTPQYSKQKNPEIIRIVGLGDSFMFGWRVSDYECYLSLLEKDLNRNFPDVSWEVINTAVPGYNTVIEVETLKTKGIQFDPNLLVIHYVGNDTDLPNFVRKKEKYFTIKKSYLLKFISHRLRGDTRRIKDPLVPSPQHRIEGRFENDPDRVPDEYRDMVGIDAYKRAMKELKALSLKHSFELLLVALEAPDYVTETCSLINVPIIEMAPKMNHFMESHGIEQYIGSVLTISKEDPHPSALGHRIIADCIFEYLKKSDLILKFTKTK